MVLTTGAEGAAAGVAFLAHFLWETLLRARNSFGVILL